MSSVHGQRNAIHILQNPYHGVHEKDVTDGNSAKQGLKQVQHDDFTERLYNNCTWKS